MAQEEGAVSRGTGETLAASLVAVWPNLPYLSLGALLAWMYLVVDFGAWMTGSDVVNLSAIDVGMHVYLSSAVVLLAAACAPRSFDRLLSLRAAPLIVGAVSVCGTVLLIASGPRFLQGLLASPVFFQGGGVLVGVGAALMTLRVGALYCTLEPARVFLYAAVSEILVAIIFYIVIGNSWIPSVPGGPPLANLGAVVLLPVLTMGIASLPVPDRDAASRPSVCRESPAVRKFFQEMPMAGKLMIAVFVFSAAASIVWNFFMLDQPPGVHQLNSQMAMLLRFAFGAVLLLAAVTLGRKIALGRLYLVCMASFALIVAALPLLNLQSNIPFVCTSMLNGIISLIVWCLLAFVANSSHKGAGLVFGLGEGFAHGGLAVGYIFGRCNAFVTLGAVDGNIGAPFAMVLMALVVSCIVLVFTEKDFDSILEASGAADLDVRAAIVRARESRLSKKLDRPWQRAARVVGERALLSRREQELLEDLARNRTPQEIAAHLSITVSTVRTHTHRIYVKLDVHSRDELIELIRREYEGTHAR